MFVFCACVADELLFCFCSIFEVAIRTNGTPLWREVHFQFKMYKTLHARTNFGSFDPQKLHAAVARSTFVRQDVQNTTLSGHFLKLSRTDFGSFDPQKLHAAVAPSTFVSQNVQNTCVLQHLERFLTDYLTN